MLFFKSKFMDVACRNYFVCCKGTFREKMFESRRESRSNSFSKTSEASEIAVMDPVEVKIKSFPRKLPNYGTLNKSEEIPTATVDDNKDKEASEDKDVTEARKDDEKTAMVFTAEPAIIIDAVDGDSSRSNTKGKYIAK